jgi:hypothetical protein
MANPQTRHIVEQLGAAGVSYLATRAVAKATRLVAGKHVVALASVLTTAALWGAAMSMKSLKKWDVGILVGTTAATLEQLITSYAPEMLVNLLAPVPNPQELGPVPTGDDYASLRSERAAPRQTPTTGGDEDDDDYGSLGGGWDGV